MIDYSQFPKNLPFPDVVQCEHLAKVVVVLREAIAKSGGAIPFAHFMHLALYAPGLGYYSAGSHKIGEEGDFVTAPEISSLFSQCVARNIQAVLQALIKADVLELGAGSGVMAKDILLYLAQQNSLPEHYYILEVSADLRARQQAYLQEAIPQLIERVVWLSRLPAQDFRGVIVGNEVVDAMPVHLFRMREDEGVAELDVEWRNGEFAFRERRLTEGALFEQVRQLSGYLTEETLYPGYTSEINLLSQEWLAALAQGLAEGVILLIDYGFPQQEYYHPDRSMGTLMCHYRHCAHDNPLILPGLQDITAHVDFSSLARAARAIGLSLLGYTSQAQFLLASGLDTLMAQSDHHDMRRHLQMTQQVKKLVMPHEMGELFKVIAFAKNYRQDLLGFANQDLSDRL